MEHSCHLCGHALGRVCALIEPIYGLPIVACPGCNATCARRRHPLGVTWREARHVVAMLIGIVWRVLGFALLVAVALGVTAALGDGLNSAGPIDLWRMGRDGELDAEWWRALEGESVFGGGFLFGGCVVWWFAVGATLTVAFAHVRRRWVVWAVFVGALFGVAAMVTLLSHASHMWQQRGAGQPQTLGQIFWDFNHMSGWMAIGLVIAFTGIPLGRALRRGLSRGEGKRWRNRYVRAHKRRMNA